MKAGTNILTATMVLGIVVGIFCGSICILAPTLSIAASTSPTSGTTSIANILKQVENSVVQITSRELLAGNLVGSQSTLGSGFIYDNQGHILTSDSIVNGAKLLNVTFIDGNSFVARVLGTDHFHDLAVLQLTGNFSAERLIPLTIANSSSLQVGQQVLAVGNPYGLSGTMTTGLITKTGGLLPDPITGGNISDAIQTDAPLNPGNGGGPLLNAQGQVIGMNVAIRSSTGVFSGIAFAIPSNTITKELPSLIHNGIDRHEIFRQFFHR